MDDKSLLLGITLESETIDLGKKLGKVVVRQLDFLEYLQVDAKMAQKDHAPYSALLTCAACRKADGTPLLSIDDAAQFSKLPAQLIKPLVLAALRLNGETTDEIKNS